MAEFGLSVWLTVWLICMAEFALSMAEFDLSVWLTVWLVCMAEFGLSVWLTF